jgi:hypothetical protein
MFSKQSNSGNRTRKRSAFVRIVPVFLFFSLASLTLPVVQHLKIRAKRNAIHIGMTPTQVLEASQGWMYCTLINFQPPEPVSITVTNTVHQDQRSGIQEIGRETEQKMRAVRGPWRMTVGYLTVPTRTYFTVDFGGDGRVSAVGDATLAVD